MIPADLHFVGPSGMIPNAPSGVYFLPLETRMPRIDAGSYAPYILPLFTARDCWEVSEGNRIYVGLPHFLNLEVPSNVSHEDKSSSPSNARDRSGFQNLNQER